MQKTLNIHQASDSIEAAVWSELDGSLTPEQITVVASATAVAFKRSLMNVLTPAREPQNPPGPNPESHKSGSKGSSGPGIAFRSLTLGFGCLAAFAMSQAVLGGFCGVCLSGPLWAVGIGWTVVVSFALSLAHELRRARGN